MDRQTSDKFSCEKTECWAGIPAKGLARMYTIDVVSRVIQIAVQPLELVLAGGNCLDPKAIYKDSSDCCYPIKASSVTLGYNSGKSYLTKYYFVQSLALWQIEIMEKIAL